MACNDNTIIAAIIAVFIALLVNNIFPASSATSENQTTKVTTPMYDTSAGGLVLRPATALKIGSQAVIGKVSNDKTIKQLAPASDKKYLKVGIEEMPDGGILVMDQMGLDLNMEVQRTIITTILIILIVYITLINLFLICTLIYGMFVSSASLALRVVLLSKRPIYVDEHLNSTDNASSSNSQSPRMAYSKYGSPASDVGSRSTDISSRGRRHAVISGSSATIPEDAFKFYSSSFPYLLSLSITDFLIGCTIAPLMLDKQITGRWRFSANACDFWRMFDIFLSTASTLHTAVIAVDRWWTITQLQIGISASSLSKIQLQRTLLIFTWMLAALISFPVIYLWQIESPGSVDKSEIVINSDRCDPVAENVYILLSTFVSFVLPLSITIFFYANTGARIKKQYKLAKMYIKQVTVPIEVGTLVTQAALGPNTEKKLTATVLKRQSELVGMLEKQLQTLKYHETMLKAMVIIVVIYIISWTPIYATLFTRVVCNCIEDNSNAEQVWQKLVIVFSWIGYVNSGLNPIIYLAVLREFRALAVALLWMIWDRISQCCGKAFEKVGNYCTAVFCCCCHKSGDNGSGANVDKEADKLARVHATRAYPAGSSLSLDRGNARSSLAHGLVRTLSESTLQSTSIFPQPPVLIDQPVDDGRSNIIQAHNHSNTKSVVHMDPPNAFISRRYEFDVAASNTYNNVLSNNQQDSRSSSSWSNYSNNETNTRNLLRSFFAKQTQIEEERDVLPHVSVRESNRVNNQTFKTTGDYRPNKHHHKTFRVGTPPRTPNLVKSLTCDDWGRPVNISASEATV